MDIGKAVRMARAAAGISVQELSDRSGISRTHLWRIQKGATDPAMGLMVKISSACGIPLSTLIFYGEDRPTRTRSSLSLAAESLDQKTG